LSGHDAAVVGGSTAELSGAEDGVGWRPEANPANSAEEVTSPFPDLPFTGEPRVLSTVAHELRGPLTALVTSAELLVEDFDSLPPEQMRQMVSTMHRGALWLHGLVENLLCAATITDGRFQVHRQIVTLGDVISEVQPVVAPLLGQKGQQLEIQMKGPIPDVLADPRRIGQVLVNLVGNASKYTDNSETIELLVGAQDGMVRTTVADRGPGIPPGRVEQLFEPFYRSSSAARSSKEGVGLGLSIVRSIVAAHDGRVGAENRHGGGACFWFELPIPIPTPTPQTNWAPAHDH
jgi:two-component system sensor histidine kinase KdpD